jgi:hypothetical protein
MGDCKYCGKPAGLLRSVHKECQNKHDSGKAEIVSLVKAAAHDSSITGSLKTASEGIAEKHFIDKSDVPAVVIEGWEKAVDGAFEDGVLTEEEESNLVEIQSHFEFSQKELDKKGAYTKVVKGVVLRELLNGKLPEKFVPNFNHPLNLQKDEKLVWLFQDVQCYELKTRRHYEGGSKGFSVRIAKGLYYRAGAFRAHPVETTEVVLVDTGILAFTNKHLYFAGGTKSFRVPYKKIVSFEPYSDGIGIQRDTATAKPQTFVTGDGWFTYNLAMNLSQL